MPWDIQPPLQICEDKQSICAGIQMFCHGENVDWMNKNCQKTCKKCPSGKTKLDIVESYTVCLNLSFSIFELARDHFTVNIFGSKSGHFSNSNDKKILLHFLKKILQYLMIEVKSAKCVATRKIHHIWKKFKGNEEITAIFTII